jgi:hypothetical protein
MWICERKGVVCQQAGMSQFLFRGLHEVRIGTVDTEKEHLSMLCAFVWGSVWIAPGEPCGQCGRPRAGAAAGWGALWKRADGASACCWRGRR